MEYQKTKVISNKKINNDIFVIKVIAEYPQIRAGQFYMLKANENLDIPLMRPISVYQFDDMSITFLYKSIGKGTQRLSALKRGNTIWTLGALGNGFPCENVHGKIALLGGGVGIPPLFETAKTLKNLGNQVDVFLGFRDKSFEVEVFADVCDMLFVSTESGTEGYKGYVTDLIDVTKYDAVFSCGPDGMLQTLSNKCKAYKIPLWLSMEKRMGCGIGSCLVCSCETQTGIKRCCKDGPIFNADDLM
jgi:dihydroorotate dehydrogenase electron transfer subunit